VSARDRSILLLPGVASENDPSMSRYARELFATLSGLSENGRITIERPVARRYLSSVFSGHHALRIDSAWTRYVAYPRSLRRREAGVFHILDHGYAQLIRSLDPDRAIVTCHDLIPLLAAEGVIPIDVPPTVARTFRLRIAHVARARRVIAVSEATKVTLERYTSVRPDRIVVIPNGVNPTFQFSANLTTTLRASLRAAAELAEASVVVLQVTSGGRYKNTTVLLHAFAQLRSRLEDVVLVRIGTPFYPDEAALARTLGIHDAIRHVAGIDDRALAQWYNAADVLVFPSLWEGFGWPPLEAMACGTPVVASNIPAVAEVVGDAGVLVPSDDPSAVARATERVLTDAALATSLRQKGLERARQFTWEQTAMRTLGVYDDMLQ
jgi:glycosyltransferase involved in cell wall biosynthesis